MEFLTGKRSVASLIEFNAMKACKCIPSFSSHGDELAALLTPMHLIDLDESVIIFVSHRGISSLNAIDELSPDVKLQPRPDTPANDKFNLIVEAVDKIMAALAPGMKTAYLWIDCACGSLPNQLPPYEEILFLTDIVLTPLYDPSVSTESKKDDKYSAKPWSHGPEAYLNRKWCRVEMLMSATTPMHGASSELRRSRLSSAFLHILDRKIRFTFTCPFIFVCGFMISYS